MGSSKVAAGLLDSTVVVVVVVNYHTPSHRSRARSR